MFNPEFRYLIALDNGDAIPFMDQRIINLNGMNLFWILVFIFIIHVYSTNDSLLGTVIDWVDFKKNILYMIITYVYVSKTINNMQNNQRQILQLELKLIELQQIINKFRHDFIDLKTEIFYLKENTR